jgi:hypothetical protein
MNLNVRWVSSRPNLPLNQSDVHLRVEYPIQGNLVISNGFGLVFERIKP